MDIKSLILDKISQKKKIKVMDIVKSTGLSRAYINRFFKELREEGKIVLVGKTDRAVYVNADKDSVQRAKKDIMSFRKRLVNKNLSEDPILDSIKRETGIFFDLSDSLKKILDHAFTEMLNNAIEHSKSRNIHIIMKRLNGVIRFDIFDFGIGIFNNIMQKENLKNELEAIQDLLKGKQTTDPKYHTGEGIFFTSKIADNFVIESSKKKLFFNNMIDDLFIHDIKNTQGTKITFVIKENSHRSLKEVFDEYSGESFEFSKTKVAVKLYKMGSTFYVSRSQARRIMHDLDKFEEVILDFKHIGDIGQAFADQVFRVWHNQHPDVKITPIHTDENIDFMINRARGNVGQKDTLFKN